MVDHCVREDNAIFESCLGVVIEADHRARVVLERCNEADVCHGVAGETRQRVLREEVVADRFVYCPGEGI